MRDRSGRAAAPRAGRAAAVAVEPLSPDALVDRLTVSLARHLPGARLRVALDGAPVAGPAALADAIAAELPRHGRPAVRVSATDFLRPAALRLEHGRNDPEALYRDTVDYGALTREVLTPLGPGGTGHYLPTFWDPVRDRATRASYEPAPPTAVLLVDGAFLLGGVLAFDVTVHLWLSPGALRRRGAPDSDVAAHGLYDDEVAPRDTADLVVLGDDPRRPALIDRKPA